MKANLVKMNIPVNKPEPKQTLQSTTGQTRLISTTTIKEEDSSQQQFSDDVKPAKLVKVHDVKDLKASETNIKRENNDSIPGGTSKDPSSNSSTIITPNICSHDSKHNSDLIIKPINNEKLISGTNTTTTTNSKQESLTKSPSKVQHKGSEQHHRHSSHHHSDSDRRSSKHSHRHDKHHSSSSSSTASKHHHSTSSSSTSKKVVNTGVQCDSVETSSKPLLETSTVDTTKLPSLPTSSTPPSLIGAIAPVRHRMFGMFGANPLTTVENRNYKYSHLMYVER